MQLLEDLITKLQLVDLIFPLEEREIAGFFTVASPMLAADSFRQSWDYGYERNFSSLFAANID